MAEIITRLKARSDVQVEHSPLNPALGKDPRWSGWYQQGAAQTIAGADCFVAIESDGYDSSTWMAHEFDVALQHHRDRGRPALFLTKVANRSLPAGFKLYEEAATILPVEPEAAVASLLAHLRQE